MEELRLVVKADGDCIYCEKAACLLEAHGISFETEAMTSEELKKLCRVLGCASTFPRVFKGDKLIGGYENLQDMVTEPVLNPSDDRFVYFPVKYPDLHQLYKKGIASFWTPEEIDLTKDAEDWPKMTEPERSFIRMVLGFFAGADGIVNENLVANFCQEVQIPEARAFYSFQAFNETQHAETYSLLLDALVKDPEEKDRLFKGIQTIGSVGAKAQWALKWLQNAERPFGERLVAFACVEGIMFSSSFCAIFWLRKRALMPGLCLSNDFIARDEGLHQTFACALLQHLKRTPSESTMKSIVKEAVDVEKAFVEDLLPNNLIGMSKRSMNEYVEYVADNLLHQLRLTPLFGTKNPFEWMETICLSGKANFFELRNSSYSKPGILTGTATQEKVFSLDAEF